MENVEVLKYLGLDDKEASVYLSLLELGTASVYSIASKSGLKRPTTYLVLDSLEQRGLVSQIPQVRKTIYVAESPEKFMADLRRKESVLNNNLPALLAIHNARKEKPRVKFFQGKNNVEQLYQRIIGAKDVRFFATIRDIQEIYPQFSKELIKKTVRGEIKVKEILMRSEEDIDFFKRVNNPNYEQKFAPENWQFPTDNVLFDNTVIFFSYRPFIYAVEISSREVYESLSTLFNMAWERAEEIDKRA